jgi:hypothetical protein
MTPEELESQVEQDSEEIVRLRDTVIADLRKRVESQEKELTHLRTLVQDANSASTTDAQETGFRKTTELLKLLKERYPASKDI